MKKIMMIMAMMTTIAVSANAMTKSEARYEASNLTDRMARELSLSRMQYDAVYAINYDYMRSVSPDGTVSSSSRAHRNAELKRVLTASQYSKYMANSYRPTARPVYNWHSHGAPKPVPHHARRTVVVRR